MRYIIQSAFNASVLKNNIQIQNLTKQYNAINPDITQNTSTQINALLSLINSVMNINKLPTLKHLLNKLTKDLSDNLLKQIL